MKLAPPARRVVGAVPDEAAAAERRPWLSWLLLATASALLVLLGARVADLLADRGELVATRPSGPAFVPPPPSVAIEPGAGPGASVATVVPASATPGETDPRFAAVEALTAELRRQQAALAEREQALSLRAAVVTAVEGRVRAQLDQLDATKVEIERLLGQISADEQARIAQLVKVYEAMKAKSAAVIFDPMALELLLPIVRRMREAKVAAIVAEMDPTKARALTAELVRRRDPPAAP